MKMIKKNSKWRPFTKARKFVRSLKIGSFKKWGQYCKGELKGYPPKPKNIPANPRRTYKGKGWQGMPDWLGNGRVPQQKKGHLPFIKAREFARSLEFRSRKEWNRYCRGELKGYPPKLRNIPASPGVVYEGKGWQGYPDWLGKNRIPFKKARKFVRSLKLRSREEWYQYCRGELKGYPPKPKNIPASPRVAYKGKGWQSTRDWLGKTR